MHRKDLDLQEGAEHVNHVLQELRGIGLVITEPKTEHSRRAVAIPLFTLEVLPPGAPGAG